MIKASGFILNHLSDEVDSWILGVEPETIHCWPISADVENIHPEYLQCFSYLCGFKHHFLREVRVNFWQSWGGDG